jgi:hypothetical protein
MPDALFKVDNTKLTVSSQGHVRCQAPDAVRGSRRPGYLST